MIVEESAKPSPHGGWRYLIVLLFGLMITATPALAKMPPFTVTVEPNPPVAGDTTTISVEFDVFYQMGEELPGLLALHRPPGQGGQSEAIAITLKLKRIEPTRIEPTRYEATVVIPEAGRWVLKAFPPGYLDTIELEVVTSPTEASLPGQGTVGQKWIDVTAVFLFSIAGLRYWLKHRGLLLGEML